MRLAIAATLLGLMPACSKKDAPAPRARTDAIAAPVARPIDASTAFTAAAVPIVVGAGELQPATLDWDRWTMTLDQLEDKLEDVDDDAAADLRARGRLVITVDDLLLQSFDPGLGKVPVRAP